MLRFKHRAEKERNGYTALQENYCLRDLSIIYIHTGAILCGVSLNQRYFNQVTPGAQLQKYQAGLDPPDPQISDLGGGYPRFASGGAPDPFEKSQPLFCAYEYNIP